jgi:chromosomal replication initiator protein
MNVMQWTTVKERLRSEVGDAAFRSWLQPVEMCSVEAQTIRLSVPSKFMRNWIESHYGDQIRNCVRLENPRIHNVELVITTDKPQQDNTLQAVIPSPSSDDPVDILNNPQQFTSLLDPRYTFDNFIVGKSNELAFAAARRVAESDAVGFNPLFLYGGVGLGKTHLMHAIAWHIATKHPKRRVLYLSAEKFMYQFIKALRFKDTMSFKENFRSVDVLMIDDVQFISGKDSTQEEFFHTFNALVDQNRQVIISADKSPSDLEGMEERLKSRLGWGLVADIHPATFELRLGILQAKAEKLGAVVPHTVLEFLATKINSNVRELEGALNRIAAHAQFVGEPLTLESTQRLLKDLLRANDKKLTIEDIQTKVAEHFNVRVSDMHSARRARNVARPRQVAMYLSKILTSRSLPDIGRSFGGRDHTTVMHAVKTIEELIKNDKAFADDVEMLKRVLG